MNKLSWVVFKRELVEMKSNKGILFSTIGFIFIWGTMPISAAKNMGNIDSFTNSFLAYLSSSLSVFVAYMFSNIAFINEKRSGTIETTLCTPLTLRELLAGKILGVLMPSYISAFVVSGLLIGFVSYFAGYLILPGIFTMLYIVFVLPVILTAFIGLYGFFQFLLGMKQVQILGIIIMVVLFGFIGISHKALQGGNVITWKFFSLIVLISLGLLSGSMYLVKYISKEKIVTSIE